MQTLRETLKEHQEATDTDDETMLNIVCEFLETQDRGPAGSRCKCSSCLIDFVVDSLERVPGDCS